PDVIANSLAVAELAWYENPTWERHVIASETQQIVNQAVADIDGDGIPEIAFQSSFAMPAAHSAGVDWIQRHDGEPKNLGQLEKQLLSPGHVEKAPRLGASDVGVGMNDGKRFVASVEPWHGNEVVIYTEKGGKWDRRVIFDKVTSGHEIAVVDLNGDGRDDIVANDNSQINARNPNGTPGVHVFFAPADPATGEWTYRRIEDKSAMNSCVGVDANGDKRMD